MNTLVPVVSTDTPSLGEVAAILASLPASVVACAAVLLALWVGLLVHGTRRPRTEMTARLRKEVSR